MDRVQLTDEEIEALAFRLEKEGHHLSAGTMRLVETLIQVRVQVENEVRDIQTRPVPVIRQTYMDRFMGWYVDLVPRWWIFGPVSSVVIVAGVIAWSLMLGMRLG